MDQPVNPMVLPGEAIGEKGVLVYLLAGATKPNSAVLGKHYRVLVSDKDRTVRSITPLSRSTLEMSTVSAKGERVAALFVTHWVTDYPLETHVLASLQAHLPLLVATQRGVWFVEDGQIAYAGEKL